MNIKRNLIPLGLFLSFSNVSASEIKTNFDGYSYFTVGMENITYEESFTNISSSVDVSSMVINTGGIYVINDKFDFSIDALATFSPDASEENWNLSGSALQKNKFEYTRASTNVQLHYKYTPEFRFLAGPSFSYQTYKRYSFEALDPRVEVIDGVVEENTTDLFFDVGVAYESAAVANVPWRYSLKALVGYPVWSEAKNTNYDGVKFSPSGYRYSLSGNISFEVLTGVHLGLYAAYHFDQRDEDGGKHFFGSDGVTREVSLPEAKTTNATLGAQVIWNL